MEELYETLICDANISKILLNTRNYTVMGLVLRWGWTVLCVCICYVCVRICVFASLNVQSLLPTGLNLAGKQ